MNRAFSKAAFPSNTALPVTMMSTPAPATSLILRRVIPPSTQVKIGFPDCAINCFTC